MAYHRPIDDPKRGSQSGFGAFIEAEKLMQVAFVLPSAVLVGWAAGWWLSSVTHQKWIEVAGVIFGCVAGLVYVIQMAAAVEKKTRTADEGASPTEPQIRTGEKGQNGTGEGTADRKP